MTRPHLTRRVCVNEWAAFSLDRNWLDCATGERHWDDHVEGRVIAVSPHRVSVHVGDGIVRVLRRHDVGGIMVNLGQ